jgi:DNA polymerase-1
MADKIMLLDGNSLINRGFYAMPYLSNKNGEYTGGVFGFLNIFFKLYDEEKPQRVAVCFDVHQPTFRHLEYKEYKGTRKGMPEELRPQLPLLKRILAAMGIKTYEMGGFEADDLLGTLATMSDKMGLEPVIVSGDRDLLQLASDTIRVRIPKTKGGQTVVEDYKAADVIEAYGVTPTEFIEVKALMGDTSDNVPGVPSIGEKTAVKIISEYKTVENAILNADKVKPAKAAANLKEFAEQARLSKWLVTIKTDVELDFGQGDCVIDNPFTKEAYELFKEYEFKSLLNRFDTKSVNKTEAKASDFVYTDSFATAREIIAGLNPFAPVSYRIIYDKAAPVALALSDEAGKAYVLELATEELLRVARDFFESDSPKIAHDGKRDIVTLARYGIKLNGIVFDNVIASYILNSGRDEYEYNELSEDFLNESYPSLEEVLGKGKSRISPIALNNEDKTRLLGTMAEVGLRARAVMADKIEENKQHELYYDIELPLIYVLADMELEGMGVDRNGLIEYGKSLEGKIAELTSDIYWLAGEEFNINSPKQLGVILFEKLALKGGKKTKTGWSTAADVLEKLKDDDEIVGKVLEYRSYMKLKSTYADGLLNVLDDKTGRIYSTFNQTVTTTGRISSTEPNLQNIPIRLELGRELRRVFVPREGFVFVDGDYSQIELRVLAAMSGDETLINAFNEGQDIHALTASQVFNVPFEEVTPQQRSNAKAVNFGIVYGIGAFSLSQDIGVSRKEAERYIEGYFEKYPKVKSFMNDMVEFARQNGYGTTIFNRVRHIPEINSSNFVQRSFGERVAMNMPVQGSAADIIKIAMVRVHKRLKAEGLRSRLILQVHDELLIEAEKSEVERVKLIMTEEMENAVSVAVPLVVDVHVGETWYEAK